MVLDDIPLRELILSLFGSDWRRRLENRSKTNLQSFNEYCDIIASSKSRKWDVETRRLLGQFRDYLGDFPPTMELFNRFFQRYGSLAQSTRARYYYVFKSFFKWYSGEDIPFKIKSPKATPQRIGDEEIKKLVAAIKDRRTHKKTAERDVLLVETAYHTGLRREELSKDHLKVADLQLSGDTPTLRVRRGKGGKDRIVVLNDYIRHRLSAFTKGKNPDESVFNLAPKSISMKINYWARKANVSLHTHSLRHKFATDIVERGGNIRAVQILLGHESLATTESYLAVSDDTLRTAVHKLDTPPETHRSPPQQIYQTSLELTVSPNTKFYGPPKIVAFSMELPAPRVIIEQLLARISDTSLPFRLAVFERENVDCNDLNKEDLVQMEIAWRRSMTWPMGIPVCYQNVYGNNRLFGAIVVGNREFWVLVKKTRKGNIYSPNILPARIAIYLRCRLAVEKY